jgi:branched-chain amino acid aminotransferase
MAPQLNWRELGFQYLQTESFVRADFTGNGGWSAIKVCTDPNMSLHVGAASLHYGQACFEGLKAFTRKDGSVALFRPEENARRMIRSAERLVMEPVPEELFLDACKKVIAVNRDWMPPYGTGASMYLRPLLIGSSPRVGISPSDDYIFLVLAMPVGPYYKNGFLPVAAMVQDKYDRAAPRGLGKIKAAANYAAGLFGDLEAKKLGFTISLYLDAGTRTHLEEFGTSNFIAITKDNKYVTPESDSILTSVTNKSLQQLAADFGLTVERREVGLAELADFAEVGACGTAAVITPVHSITHNDRVYTFGRRDEAGPVLTRLYRELLAIQYGEVEDRHGWMVKVA